MDRHAVGTFARASALAIFATLLFAYPAAAETIELTKVSALRGDAGAQRRLAFAYVRGAGVPQDYVPAHAWYSLAVANGDKEAFGSLEKLSKLMSPEQIAQAGRLADLYRKEYEAGLVALERRKRLSAKVAPDENAKAATGPGGSVISGDPAVLQLQFEELNADAEFGFADDQFSLAVVYENGNGVPQNYVEAHAWYRVASLNGYPDAASASELLAARMTPEQLAAAKQLASEYVEKYLSGVESFLETKLRAELGDPRAQGELALQYSNGFGVPRDLVQAHAWYNVAAANGDLPSASERDQLAARMTAEQIADAQQLAAEYFQTSKRNFPSEPVSVAAPPRP